jgi:GTPase Era involved in 16S rRNA processing
MGNNFSTVSIIGAQSAGKSTLSNAMFKTKFKMMDMNQGVQQTTLGIWAAVDL